MCTIGCPWRRFRTYHTRLTAVVVPTFRLGQMARISDGMVGYTLEGIEVWITRVARQEEVGWWGLRFCFSDVRIELCGGGAGSS